MKCISAHTAMTYPYPPYINVSRHADHNGVRITVRSGANADGSCGPSSFIDLNAEEYEKLLADMTAVETGAVDAIIRSVRSATEESHADWRIVEYCPGLFRVEYRGWFSWNRASREDFYSVEAAREGMARIRRSFEWVPKVHASEAKP